MEQLGQNSSLILLVIPVVLIQFGLMLVALLDVLKRERFNLLPKWGWALVVVFVGIVGPIIYFVIGRGE